MFVTPGRQFRRNADQAGRLGGASGFDPHLPLYRDDVDFCWRVHRAGGRVLVAADAVLHHRETSAHGRRQVRDGDARQHRADREAAIRVLLTHATTVGMFFVALRLLIGSAIRALTYLVGKDLAAARDEVSAQFAVLAKPRRLRASRSLVSRSSVEPASVVRSLRPTTVDQLRDLGEAVGGALTTSSATGPSSVSALESGPIDDESAYLPDDSSGVLRRILLAPGVVATMALLVVAAIATRGLWWGEGVSRRCTSSVPEGARDVWASYMRAGMTSAPGRTHLRHRSSLWLGSWPLCVR